MGLREVLAELDVRVRGGEQIDHTNQAIDSFIRKVQQQAPQQTYARNVGRVYGETARAAPATTNWASALMGVNAALGIAGQVLGVVERVLAPVVDSLREVIELGDQLDDASRRTGVSAEELQRWTYVAESMGVEAGDLNAGMRAFGRTMGAAVRGQGQGVRAFRALGVSVRDGNGQFRSRNEVMHDAIAALQRIEDPTRRAAMAQTIFGRGAEDMGAILNSTNAQLEAANARFSELGGGLSNDVVAQAGAADDAMRDFRLVMLQLKGVLVTSILPTITRVISTFATLVGGLAQAIRRSSALDAAFGSLAAVVVALSPLIAAMAVAILLVPAALVFLFLAVEDVITAFRGGRSVFDDAFRSLQGGGDTVVTVSEAVRGLGLAWTRASFLARSAVAEMLEGVVAAARGLGVTVPGGLEHAMAAARMGAEQARAQDFRENAAFVRDHDARVAEENRLDALTNAPPPVRAANGRGRSAPVINSPVTITVPGTGDPDAVARRVSRRVNQERFQQSARVLLPQAAGGD